MPKYEFNYEFKFKSGDKVAHPQSPKEVWEIIARIFDADEQVPLYIVNYGYGVSNVRSGDIDRNYRKVN
jgi:hypothetical protein